VTLREKIETLFAQPEFSEADRLVYEEFKTALRRGAIRSAEKGADGVWRANSWVKQGILLGFRMGKMVEMSKPTETLQFFDKDTFPLRPMTLEDGVRIVMGGSAIRDGSYVAPSVVVVPPAYINVGATWMKERWSIRTLLSGRVHRSGSVFTFPQPLRSAEFWALLHHMRLFHLLLYQV